MRKTLTAICLLAFIGLAQPASASQALKGPYFGQEPPGTTPVVFAPGFISMPGSYELNSVFSPDGTEFFFARSDGKYTMWVTRMVGGVWQKPQVATFSGTHSDVDMMYSLDGSKLYFCSNRPFNGRGGPLNIVVVEKKADGWSDPVRLPNPINSAEGETYPCFVRDGSLYFASNRPGGLGDKDIYVARMQDGKLSDPVNLGPAINSQYGEGDMFVDPDERFIIFNTWNRPDCTGRGDLFISVRGADGAWKQAVKMGPDINTVELEFCPVISTDGKYLFFTRAGDIYWVSTEILQAYLVDGK